MVYFGHAPNFYGKVRRNIIFILGFGFIALTLLPRYFNMIYLAVGMESSSSLIMRVKKTPSES